MQTSFVFEHIPSSEPLENHAKLRIEEHLLKVAHKPISLRISYRQEGNQKCASGQFYGGDGVNIHMESKKGDFYLATNEMIDKMTRHLKRHKEKLTDHHDPNYEHHNLEAIPSV